VKSVKAFGLAAICMGFLCAQAPAQICPQSLITADDGADEDNFGYAVALCGDTAAIGAYGDRDAGFFTGSVYIFRHDGDGWVFEQKILAPDAAQSDYFGVSVALSHDRLVVGAHSAFPSDSNGKAHVFRFDGAEWRHEQRLEGSQAGDSARFGRSVAIHGGTILVGSTEDYFADHRGKTYVFELRGDEGWQETAILTASDGDGNDEFGHAVAISGDLAVIGAPNHPAAYAFRRAPDGSWSQEFKFGGGRDSLTGSAVDAQEDLVVIGRPGGSSGRADIYRRRDGEWILETFVSGNNKFGQAVVCADDLVIVGGRYDHMYGSKHAARLYRYDGSAWALAGAMTDPTNPGYDNGFSSGLALWRHTVLVGAPKHGDAPLDRPGAVHVFGLAGCTYCPADFDGDGVVNTLDVTAFLNAFAAGDAGADFHCDGAIDTRDVLEFLNAWSAGC
jgi:hypothetical protein